MTTEAKIRLLIDNAQGASTLKELRTSLKDIRSEMLNIEDTSSPAFGALAGAAAEAEDRLRDVNESIAALDPGARAAAFANFGSAVASAFQIATGAAALFGAETEQVQQVLLKVQAVTAIAQGFQGLAEAQKAAALAARVLNATLAATNPVLLAVGAAVGALIAVYVLLKLQQEESIEVNNAYADSLEETGRFIENNQDLIEQETKALIERKRAVDDSADSQAKFNDQLQVTVDNILREAQLKALRENTEGVVASVIRIQDALENFNRDETLNDRIKGVNDEYERLTNTIDNFIVRTNKEGDLNQIDLDRLERLKQEQRQLEETGLVGKLTREELERLQQQFTRNGKTFVQQIDDIQKTIEDQTPRVIKNTTEISKSLDGTADSVGNLGRAVSSEFSASVAGLAQDLDGLAGSAGNAARQLEQAATREMEITISSLQMQSQAYADFAAGRIKTERELQLRLAAIQLEADKERLKLLKEGTQEYLEILVQIQEQELALAEQQGSSAGARVQKFLQEAAQYLQAFQQLAQQVSQIILQQIQAETQARLDAIAQQREVALDDLEQRREAGFVSDREAAQQREQLQKQFAAKERKEKEKAYKAEKEAAIVQAAINGALAITNILATVPKFDFGVSTAILTGIAIATTAAQIALIASKPTPKFASGGLVKGPGTGKSDSVGALLSNGEFVINAESTRAYRPLLEAINSEPRRTEGPRTESPVRESGANVPARVYVLESDITDAQRRADTRRARATY